MDDPWLRHHFAFPAKQPWAMVILECLHSRQSTGALQSLGPPAFWAQDTLRVTHCGGYVHTPLSSPTMHLPTILPTRAVQGCWLGGAVDPFQAHPLVLSPPICVFPPGMLQLNQTSEPPDGWLKDRFWPHPSNF